MSPTAPHSLAWMLHPSTPPGKVRRGKKSDLRTEDTDMTTPPETVVALSTERLIPSNRNNLQNELSVKAHLDGNYDRRTVQLSSSSK
jgi:hypothetical protein